MRKFNKPLLIVFAIVTCSSCSQDEPADIHPDSSAYIVFNTPAINMGGVEITDMTRAETRATLQNELTDGSSFGVLGYCVPKEVGNNNDNYQAADQLWATKYETSVPDVFNNNGTFVREVSYTNNACKYSNLVPWYTTEGNASYRYTFFAYYPYTSSRFSVLSPTSITGKGAPKLKYTMPFTSSSDQTSLDVNAAEDAMVAVTYNHLKSNGNVNLNFGHLLTGLRFRANNYDDNETLTITHLSIKGTFYRSIELDFTPTGNPNKVNTMTQKVDDNDTYAGTYTLYNNSAGITIQNGTSKSLYIGEGEEGTSLMLIPKVDGDGKITKTGLEVTVGYKFRGVEESGKTLTLDAIEGNIFEQGTHYTMNLNFIGDSFTISFTSNDRWENGTNNGGDNEIHIH